MPDAIAPAAAPQNGTPRNSNGQFSPKAGATGVVPQEGAAPTQGGQENAPPSGPTTPEEWSFEGEVDVYGEKQPVKWKSKAEALRAAQELAAYRKRVRDISEREKKWERFESMSAEEKAQMLGYDAKEAARREVLRAAKAIDLTPEQRELEELRDYKAQQAEREKKADADRAEQQKQQERLARRQRAVAGLEKGLELSGLPKTHATMALLAEIQQEATANRMPELPPELLAAEANKRYAERGIEPLKALKGKALLERLTPEVVREVLLAERERRGLAAGQPRAAPSGPPPDERLPPPGEKVYGEAEAEQKLRELRNRSR